MLCLYKIEQQKDTTIFPWRLEKYSEYSGPGSFDDVGHVFKCTLGCSSEGGDALGFQFACLNFFNQFPLPPQKSNFVISFKALYKDIRNRWSDNDDYMCVVIRGNKWAICCISGDQYYPPSLREVRKIEDHRIYQTNPPAIGEL